MNGWREEIHALRKILSYDYMYCLEHEADEILARRLTHIQRGNAYYLKGILQAAELYRESPAQDLFDYLQATRQRITDTGLFQHVLTVELALLEHSNLKGEERLPAILRIIPVAQMCSEHELAAEFLREAKSIAGTLAPRMEEYLKRVPELVAAWEKEKHLRKLGEESGTLPLVRLHTTLGDVVIELYENDAPNSVAHFLDLIQQGVYNGLQFYEVIQQGWALTGSPANNGQSDLNHVIESESRLETARQHFRGNVTLLAAHEGNHSGSVIGFCRVENLGLDGVHTVIGRLVEGNEVIDYLNKSLILNTQGGYEPNPRFTPDRIVRAEVIRGPATPRPVQRVKIEIEGHDHQHNHRHHDHSHHHD